jgi:choline dehydrogenase-like flavoprotein
MGLDENLSGVNPEGKLWHYDNIWVTDASIIPDNIGESPQGTIMALSHLIMDQHLAQYG